MLFGKAKVAPTKPTTIPRLELQAAVMAARMSSVLRQELRQKIDAEYFWCDSKITLGYIHNDAKRFHIYVANRVQEIRERCQPEQWRYIPTIENPADAASRGLTVHEINTTRWLEGPKFLWQTNIDTLTTECSTKEIDCCDLEVKHIKALAVITQPTVDITEVFKSFSKWDRLVKAIGNAAQICKQKKWLLSPLCRRQLSDAQSLIIQKTQQKYYTGEIER